MDDDLTEFTELNPEELHLVGAAANQYTALVAKGSDRISEALAALDQIGRKGKSKMSKKSMKKMIKEAIASDVNMAGSGSTSAGRLSRSVLDSIVDDSRHQTREISSIGGRRAVIKSFQDRVTQAEARLAAAAAMGRDFERTTAAAELGSAQRSLAMAKMVMKEQAHERGVPRSHMGPGWTDLFNGTTHSLPADREVKGWDGPGRP